MLALFIGLDMVKPIPTPGEVLVVMIIMMVTIVCWLGPIVSLIFSKRRRELLERGFGIGALCGAGATAGSVTMHLSGQGLEPGWSMIGWLVAFFCMLLCYAVAWLYGRSGNQRVHV